MAKKKLVASFEEACKKEGLNPEEEIPFKNPANGRQKAVNAAAKLFIISKALNGDWKPDWNNWNQGKYYPWFNMQSTAAGGSGFSFRDFGYGDSDSRVGSRLVYKDSKTAEYAGTQFLEIYRDLMVDE